MGSFSVSNVRNGHGYYLLVFHLHIADSGDSGLFQEIRSLFLVYFRRRKMSNLPRSDSVQIREVWDDNVAYEMELIEQIVDSYPYIAMDTEFPGTVIPPTGVSKSKFDYKTVKENVDVLKLIQLGLTFFDDKGNLPSIGNGAPCVWQFNFEFDLTTDRHDTESIKLLAENGIDFKKIKEKGVNATKFSELFMPSGAVLKDKVHWVTFHGAYDLAYLLKLLTGKPLPDTKQDFMSLLNIFFRNLYDVKILINSTNGLFGGLKMVAKKLGVQGIGASHQAAPDSWCTCATFLRLKESLPLPIEDYAGKLYWPGPDEGDKSS